jgi:23S rRNA (cytidine1920-2'-O)/16S rRNA (cytidine1409-2'-O)-methyltransferase
MAKFKERLDKLCVQRGLVQSRQRAQALILAGKVSVFEQVHDKAGSLVPIDAKIEIITSDHPYVSRGGLKLEAALRAFPVEIENQLILDIGASTGGFTDCLLLHGAAHVIAVDVGYGQLAWKLRNDPRVTNLERQNARNLDAAHLRQQLEQPQLWPPSLATIDVSFISLRLVLPTVSRILGSRRPIIALIKPQFEAERKDVSKGGVVRDAQKRLAIIEKLLFWANEHGYLLKGRIPSPIPGPKGNLEELVLVQTPAELD